MQFIQRAEGHGYYTPQRQSKKCAFSRCLRSVQPFTEFIEADSMLCSCGRATDFVGNLNELDILR